MPTHDEWTQFLREWAKLTPQQQTLFLAAVEEMVEALRAHAPFRASLHIKGVKRRPGVFGMTWAPDGRATFHYGTPVIPGEEHIVGEHDILQNP